MHTLGRLALRLIVLAVIFWIIAALVPGIHVHGGASTYLWIAFLWSVVNLVVGTILRLVTLPLIFLTFGLILILVNTALVAITAGVSSDLDCDSFLAALEAAVLISLFSWLAELVIPGPRRKRA